MQWIRANWLALIVVLAIGASFVAAREDSRARTDAQRINLIQGCIRNSSKTALDTAYKMRTADARRSTGDDKIADDYDAFARGALISIPAPKGFEESTALIGVRLNAAGDKYVLTKQAVTLQRAGCERAYR